MAAPLLQNFATLVSNQIAAVQTQASALVNFTTGSINRATINASAAVGLWLQGIALQVMALSRFASSFGSDADSWGKDWGFYRLAALPSIGAVTFYRFTPTAAAFIPVGAIVQTADTTQQFAVVADPTNAAWNGSNGFVLAATVASLTCKVWSVNAAAAANVAAGSISQSVTSIPGVDYCSNAAATTGGADPESDVAFKARFPNFLQSIARGTVGAITAAIEGIQAGLEVQIVENYTYGGVYQPGYLTVIVDDGTGAPPSSLLSAAAVAVNNYRAAGIQAGVFGPTIITINVTYNLTVAPGYQKPALLTISENAVTAFIDAILDGGTVDWSQIYQVIYNSSPGISGPGGDVTNLLINGGTADIVPAHIYDVIKAGSVVGT